MVARLPVKQKELSSNLTSYPKVMLNEVRYHISMIWYLLRTRQWQFYRLSDKRRIGPNYTWYDGPHYIFDWWFGGVILNHWQDHEAWRMKADFRDFMKRLIKRSF